jgi:NhaC family Na+:H+ antiporter
MDAIVPLVTLIVLIAGSVALFGSSAVDGPMQVALILSVMVASFIILKNGHPWDAIVKSSQTALSSLPARFYPLLAVGALAPGTCPAQSQRWSSMAFNCCGRAISISQPH